MFWGVDLPSAQGPEEKASSLQSDAIKLAVQAEQKKKPDCRISIEKIDGGSLLSKVAEGLHGQGIR